jgi:hypothetical protein
MKSLLLLLFCAASCSSSAPGSGNRTISYSLSTTSLTFNASGSDPGPPSDQTVTVTPIGGTVYLKATFSGPPIASATVVGSNLSIGVVGPAAAPGTSTGTVTVIGCSDPLCGDRLADSPQTVSVTYHVSAGGLATSANLVELVGPLDGGPIESQITLNDSAGASYPWTSSVVDQVGPGGWLSVSPDAGSGLPASIVFTATPSSIGLYESAASFMHGGGLVDVTVVGFFGNSGGSGLQATPNALHVTGARGVPTPNQTLTLSDSAGGSYAWMATNLVPGGVRWLSYSPTSGTSLPATLTVSFATLPDTQKYFGSINLAQAGSADIAFPVLVTYQTP